MDLGKTTKSRHIGRYPGTPLPALGATTAASLPEAMLFVAHLATVSLVVSSGGRLGVSQAPARLSHPIMDGLDQVCLRAQHLRRAN